jgi:hypothetical protein
MTVPAALTEDRFQAQRMLPLPVMLLVLAALGLKSSSRAPSSPGCRG